VAVVARWWGGSDRWTGGVAGQTDAHCAVVLGGLLLLRVVPADGCTGALGGCRLWSWLVPADGARSLGGLLRWWARLVPVDAARSLGGLLSLFLW
jgi:hypothetical protein